MTIVKIAKSSRSYGRGMDNHYTPAQYRATMRDGTAWLISSRAIGYMEKASWTAKLERKNDEEDRAMFGPFSTKARLIEVMEKHEPAKDGK